jgi:hypothetical protein
MNEVMTDHLAFVAVVKEEDLYSRHDDCDPNERSVVAGHVLVLTKLWNTIKSSQRGVHHGYFSRCWSDWRQNGDERKSCNQQRLSPIFILFWND